ncbi:MAG: hypothetical protein KF830_09860 [Planctomycetes bacterium]|nr:hypothetical protein [Planctomycetota bacterium]
MPHRTLALLLPLSAVFAQQVTEGPEPNSSVATATMLPCGAQGLGALGTTVDVDWWALSLATPAELFVETLPGGGAQIGDTILTLLDAGGAPLRTNDDGLGAGLYSRLHVPWLAAGSYFAVVQRGAAAPGTGTYRIDVRCAPFAPSGSGPLVAEGPENNDPRTGGTPTTVPVPSRCSGSLSSTGPGGDWDFYRFTLLEPSLLRARVDATAAHPVTPRTDDPVLHLFSDGSPPQLLAAAAAGTTFGVWNAELAVHLPVGVYQVAVRGWQDSPAGSYYLDLRRVRAASATAEPGGCAGRTLELLRTDLGPGAPLALERPVIGRTYALFGSNLGANGLAVHAYGVTPVDVDLAPVGAPGCFLKVDWIDLVPLFADGAGTAAVALALGEDPTLLGVPLVNQLGVLDFSNPLGITTSNSVHAVMGY